MGSTRLPGKVMLDLCGRSVLARVVSRVRRARLAGQVVVATTRNTEDDRIAKECRNLGVDFFRGSEDDVLDRYYRAARKYSADAVVRICSDSPLTDPEVIDETIRQFLDSGADYASNSLGRCYPLGLDVEVMKQEVLACSWREARAFYQRSHVTPFIYENPQRFQILRITAKGIYSGHRWTLDTAEDYRFLKAVYERMPDPNDFSWIQVLGLLEREPELVELNQHILQKELQAG